MSISATRLVSEFRLAAGSSRAGLLLPASFPNSRFEGVDGSFWAKEGGPYSLSSLWDE